MSHLGKVHDIDEEIYPLGCPVVGKQLGGPQHDRHQVKDWNMFEGEKGHGEAEKKVKKARNRTGVDPKHDDWNDQDTPTLVRT